jgi:hypothetical protein
MRTPHAESLTSNVDVQPAKMKTAPNEHSAPRMHEAKS